MRLAHKKWDNVKGIRQPRGRRAKYKLQGEPQSTTEAAVWMAVMGMAIASGAAATSAATLAAGLATGAATGIPVAPMAAVATGMEVNMRSRQNELARIWRTLDPGEQARAWKKERQRQTEEDKECQRKPDKEWEQRAEAMYASRGYARPVVLKEAVLSSKSQDAHQDRWQVCRGINRC